MRIILIFHDLDNVLSKFKSTYSLHLISIVATKYALMKGVACISNRHEIAFILQVTSLAHKKLLLLYHSHIHLKLPLFQIRNALEGENLGLLH